MLTYSPVIDNRDAWYLHPDFAGIDLMNLKIPHLDITIDLVVGCVYGQLFKIRDACNNKRLSFEQAQDIQDFLKQFKIEFNYN